MEYELTVEARTENNDAVLSFLDPLLEKNGFSKKAQIELNIAVEELFVNIAHYAYAPGIGSAKILTDFRDNAVFITLIDQGTPYNPLEREDPDITLSAEERKIGGLGIYMVKKTMDDVQYIRENGSNRITIRLDRVGEMQASGPDDHL